MQCMRSAIPAFSVVTRPLSNFLEKFYKTCGKRTRQAAARISLFSLEKDEAEKDAFEECKADVHHQTTVAHRDGAKRLCVFTDASDVLWSGIFKQVPSEDLPRPHVDQRRQPLCFLSGYFTGSQLG